MHVQRIDFSSVKTVFGSVSFSVANNYVKVGDLILLNKDHTILSQAYVDVFFVFSIYDLNVRHFVGFIRGSRGPFRIRTLNPDVQRGLK